MLGRVARVVLSEIASIAIPPGLDIGSNDYLCGKCRTDKGGFRGGGGLWGLQPPRMILRSPAHLGLKYESCPVFLTGP